jgi:hypothetical protein
MKKQRINTNLLRTVCYLWSHLPHRLCPIHLRSSLSISICQFFAVSIVWWWLWWYRVTGSCNIWKDGGSCWNKSLARLPSSHSSILSHVDDEWLVSLLLIDQTKNQSEAASHYTNCAQAYQNANDVPGMFLHLFTLTHHHHYHHPLISILLALCFVVAALRMFRWDTTHTHTHTTRGQERWWHFLSMWYDMVTALRWSYRQTMTASALQHDYGKVTRLYCHCRSSLTYSLSCTVILLLSPPFSFIIVFLLIDIAKLEEQQTHNKQAIEAWDNAARCHDAENGRALVPSSLPLYAHNFTHTHTLSLSLLLLLLLLDFFFLFPSSHTIQ